MCYEEEAYAPLCVINLCVSETWYHSKEPVRNINTPLVA